MQVCQQQQEYQHQRKWFMCEKALQVEDNQTIHMADNAAVMKNLVAVGFACWDLATAVTWCQVAEIPAKKLKRGRRKKKLAEKICDRILPEFYQKVAEKGPQKIFKRSSLFLVMITTYNVHQADIKFDF